MDERAFSVRNMFGSTGDARNYVSVQDPIAGALRSVSARITGMAQESSRVLGLAIVLSKNRSKRRAVATASADKSRGTRRT